jgi:hypothetical protein
MPTYMPTRLVATTDSHSAHVAHASNRLRTTLRLVAAIPCTPPAHHRTSLLWSPSSDFVPSQPHQLLANSIQSPYIHRANGLLQIAVSTLLRTAASDQEKSCSRSTVDTALEIYRQLTRKRGGHRRSPLLPIILIGMRSA